MSAQSLHYPPFRQPSYRQPPTHASSADLISKAPYEDIIDEYSSSFSPDPRAHTLAVDTNLPYYPLDRQSQLYANSPNEHYSSKQSDETHDTSHAMYPPPLLTKSAANDPRSIWQKVVIFPESIACRLYVLTVLLETTVDLAIEGELYIRIKELSDATTESSLEGNADKIAVQRMPVYLGIFAFAHVFQFAMALDAVYARNTLQFLALTIFNALFLIYAVIQIKEIQEAVSATASAATGTINILTIIIPIVISVAEVAYIGLGWKIYNEFGWKVYKFLGADRRIRKMYGDYQVYQCLIKFDIFFWVGFSAQFIWLVLNKNDWEFYVTCAALPLSLVLLVEGHLASRHEHKGMMLTFMTGCIGAMIYFIYKSVKVLLKINTEFAHIWKSLTVFSAIAIVLLFITFLYSVFVLRNFGKGLKKTLLTSDVPFVVNGGGTTHGRKASATLNRMSIT
ncbi:hypothetical protein BDQ17DRAFT_1294387 [Cyathus striatus]|nr:hypothetical protein BDQ17DRAFT_1294387 [Cyathus striatus]